ncbi:hypothetical protein CBR_g2966 [Chara braunii]|uniref:Uncharacterized protein n=1 Tax=Chara braunii TaxID=69332 RepID=A0A388KED5_CHABU|nr:hypothetical protein CBR_g2966 [Chara braunii]|eukprot:GBG68422.1 hypothetical protein CBR_g2966 [Chara braunii]
MTRGQGYRQQRLKTAINMAAQHFGNEMEVDGELQCGDSFYYTEIYDTNDDVWCGEDNGHDEVDVASYYANLSTVHVEGVIGDDEQEEGDVDNSETGTLEDDDVIGYFAAINSVCGERTPERDYQCGEWEYGVGEVRGWDVEWGQKAAVTLPVTTTARMLISSSTTTSLDVDDVPQPQRDAEERVYIALNEKEGPTTIAEMGMMGGNDVSKGGKGVQGEKDINNIDNDDEDNDNNSNNNDNAGVDEGGKGGKGEKVRRVRRMKLTTTTTTTTTTITTSTSNSTNGSTNINNPDDGDGNNHKSSGAERGADASNFSIMGKMLPSVQWGGTCGLLWMANWGLRLKLRFTVPLHPCMVFIHDEVSLHFWHRVGIG